MGNRKTYKVMVAACLLLIISSCSTKKGFVKNEDVSFSQEDKYGLYTYHVKKTLSINDPIIYGSIFQFNSTIKIPGTNVRVDKKKLYDVDKNGDFAFKIKPGRHSFRGIAITYKQLSTRYLNVSKGDSVRIIFNLKDDDPLID